MKKIRNVIIYKNYFEEFCKANAENKKKGTQL